MKTVVGDSKPIKGFSVTPKVSLEDLKKVIHYPSALILILANLLVLLGAIFFDWNVIVILYLYWFESAIIGFYTILKMLFVKKIADQETLKHSNIGKLFSQADKSSSKLVLAKFFMIIFFIFHFGMFMLAHLFFLTFLSIILILPLGWTFETFFQTIISIGLGILVIFTSHGFSFLTNYIGKKEYQEKTLVEVMGAPYPRVIVMHFVVLLSFFLIFPMAILGKIVPITILVVMKTFFDLVGHASERKRFGSL